jgi:broad-specificity NMP kinase
MGVGKTTTCQMLRDKLKGSVFLDGDWCLDMPSAGYFDDIVSHLNTG